MQHPPAYLQPVLWSTKSSTLDITKDKTYIIHQILSYGSMKDWRWLLKTYGKEDIVAVFTNNPYKDYRHARFLFVKNFLLPLKKEQLDESHYVKNISRNIR